MNLKTTAWDVAYRNKTGQKSFRVIQAPANGWAADPFLFTKDDTVYVFAEIWDYKENKGYIGYKTLMGKDEWKPAIIEPFHLSYPFIFEYENKIYLCPESYQDHAISIYQATNFPQEWNRVYTVKDQIEAADTTFFSYSGKKYGFTYDLRREELGTFVLSDSEPFKIEKWKNVSWKYETKHQRPGGNVIMDNERNIRVSQDCTHFYGEALVFSEFSIDEELNYSEKILRKVTVKEIPLEGGKKYIGCHTYNQSGDYEIVDLKYTCFHAKDIFYRVLRRLKWIK